MKKLCLFDLDGTLMNTIGTIAGYANQALAEAGLRTFTEEDYKYFVGNGARLLIERALKAQNAMTEENFKKVFARYNELYDGAPYEGSAPYEGVCELLSHLASHGILTAVLSNKPDFATRAVVSHFFPSHTFSAAHGGRDGVALKPSPEGALLILEELGGISPRDVLYIGDTAVDMDTGRAAGFETVGVLWGFRKEEELRAHHATHIVSDAKDILKLALTK